MSPTLRRRAEELDLETLREQVSAWYAVKRQSSVITDKLNEGKKKLVEIVQRFGEKDPEKGSLFLKLEEPVGEKRISVLKYQRSSSRGTNEQEIERILRRKDLWDSMTRTIQVPDSDLIFAGYYDGKITEDELEQMFPQNIRFSFILLDDNEKPVA